MADISKIKLPDGTTYNIKDATARGYVTGVKGNSESSYRTGNVNLTPANIGAANASHNHLPNEIYATSTYGLSANIDMLSGAKVGSYASNKTFGLPASAIKIEYSNDGGVTWTDYGATDPQKKDLFSETRGTSFYIGKSTTGATKSLNDRLRVTITPTDRYVTLDSIYLWYSTQGNKAVIDLERSTIGAKETYTTVFTDQPINGWSGHNIRYFSSGSFGGGSNKTSNYYNYRVTFRMTELGSTQYAAGIINDIRFFGKDVYSDYTGNGMISSNHLYNWNYNLDATFPQSITAKSGYGMESTAVTGSTINDFKGSYLRFAKINNAPAEIGLASNDGIILWIPYSSSYGRQIILDDTGHLIVSRAFSNGTWSSYRSLLNATTVNDHTVDSNVPANAKFTDTVTTATTTGSGNAVTAITASNGALTVTKGTTFLTQHQDISGKADKSTTVTNVALATNKITKTINGTTTDVVGAASTSGYGITKLNTATNSTSTTEAATPSAVKIAKDRADEAYSKAATVESGLNGSYIYDHTFSITNGVATFTPHVYLKGAEVTSTFAASCFVWKYRLIDGSEVTLTTKSDRGCDVTITSMGYGGHVIGAFTPPA